MRIRTIKPEFFVHEELFDAEAESGLPLRLAFAGLWCASDREGRFQWRPRTLKLGILPYDDVDFGAVLDALEDGGFVVRYEVDGKQYGEIPSWPHHQVINGRESDSKIPQNPAVDDASGTREARVEDASDTRHVHARGEGKGREGKGKERRDCEAGSASAGADGPGSQRPEHDQPAEAPPAAETAIAVTPEPDPPPSPPPKDPKQDPTPYRDIVRAFNEIVAQREVTWPAVQKKTKARCDAMRARWRTDAGRDVAAFADLFRRAADSDFLSGRNGRWSGCNFDWFLKPANWAKVVEGTYDQNRAQTRKTA